MPPVRRRPPQKAADTRKAIKNILSLLKDYRLKLAATFVCAVISTLFSIASPLLIGMATTTIFNGINAIMHNTGTMNFNRLFMLLTTAVVLYVVSAVFSYLQSWFLIDISTGISYNLRKRLMDKIMMLPLKSTDENRRGDILSRITNDIDSLQTGITQAFLQLMTAVITIIGVFIMMLTINLWMTLATVVLVPVSFIVIRFITKHSQSYFLKQLVYKGSLNSQIEETFTGHDIIRVFNQEDTEMEKFEKDNDNWFSHEWKSQFFSSLNGPLMNFISNFAYVVIAVLGAIFVVQKAIAVGDILAFFQYIKNFTQPIQQITRVMNLVQTAMAASERIFEFLDYENEENTSDVKITTFKNEISFENVSFGYDSEMIIQNLSFTVRKGEKIAIIGETGAGKTTIVKLLMRFYDVSSGEIKIDGVNINEYDKNSLRRLMGMVLQDSWLFSDTIANNIRYGKLKATDSEIRDVSRKVHADSFINHLPDNYNNVLNEDSDNISHGQKQLLTIARTILADRQILILDEATSSVDTRLEKLIQQAMDTLTDDKTSFIIAHRLSTIQNADKIIAIENGQITEMGTHKELLAKKGYYYNTLMSQDRENSR